KLANQEEEMANLRATRRQEARDREAAMEEFLDLQIQSRLDLIMAHFEFRTIPKNMSSYYTSTSPRSSVFQEHQPTNQDDDINKRKISDMEETNITIYSSYDDDDDDDDDDDEEQQRQQLPPNKSEDANDVHVQLVSTSHVPDAHYAHADFDNTIGDEDALKEAAAAATAAEQRQQQESLHSLPSSSSSDDNLNEGNADANESTTTSLNIRQVAFSQLSNSMVSLTKNSNSDNDSSIMHSWLSTFCRPTQKTIAEADEECCCICLESYQPGDVVCWAKQQSDHTTAENSKCHHMFHKECAVQWFLRKQTNNQCPMCRVTLLPTIKAQGYETIQVMRADDEHQEESLSFSHQGGQVNNNNNNSNNNNNNNAESQAAHSVDIEGQ
ncbi:MAG: hypothetical protein SGBAC_012397, partial [Bacillariaceae sp.]